MTAAPTIHLCEQRTPEWFALRAGKVTASRMGDVLAKIQKGEAAARRNYRAQLVAETFSGLPTPEKFLGHEMQERIELEKFARAAYELRKDVMVEMVGFVTHAKIARFGASPDFLVGDDGMGEIKCFSDANHLECLLTGAIPEECFPQMRAGLSCTGRQWCDFVGYHPQLPLFLKRFHRDEKRIAEMDGKVLEFLGEVDDVLRRLAGLQRDEDLVPILTQSLELVRNGHGPQLVVPVIEAMPEEWEVEF